MAYGPGQQDPPQQPHRQPGQMPPAFMQQEGWGAPPPQTPVHVPPPAQPRKRPKGGRVIAEIVGGVVLLFLGVAIGSTGKTTPSSSPAASSSQPAQAAATSAPPAPTPVTASPNGTYQGACNYTLGDNPVGGTAVATGDVQVTNTGNIGTVVRVKITWPQQGYPSLAMTRKIRLTAGASQDVQYHMPLTYDQISNLQNWQTGHNYQDGCTYKATIMRTFGHPQQPRYVCRPSPGMWVRRSGCWWFGTAGGGRTLECSGGPGCEPGEAGDDAGALEQSAEIDQPG